MNFAYTAYTEDKRLVKGKVSAYSEEAATQLLGYGGYRVVSLKSVTRLIDKEKLMARFTRIKPQEVVMFSRQLALLLESGTDIATSLDLLQEQTDNQILNKTIGEVASDIRGGTSLSVAFSRHPRAFSSMYYRAIAAGEQGGKLEVVLRQMASHIEKSIGTEKQIRNALTYPFIVVLVAVIVVIVLVTFVLPAFTGMYKQFGVELPLMTRILMGITDWASRYGVYLIIGILVAAFAVYFYIRTPGGKRWWDATVLKLPVLGRIVHLGELGRCCRTMALLIRIGLPLPEVMAMTIFNSNNKVMGDNLTEVQQELIRGEGLSRPMAKRALFLPLMTQMVKVGEETGNLDNTLDTVADSFEMESGEKTKSAVALIQPVMTIIIGLLVGFVVLAMVSAMYSIYGSFEG
ncbi:MAG: type II secretion system F family protein [Dehalococcoidia bacterium]|nr:type II secretion system F family protein [Dehalococcoidia bacterium]